MPHIEGTHRVVDCTFYGGRKQSDILKEVDEAEVIQNKPEVPNSLTPEQLKTYCLQCINSTSNQAERRVYAELIRIIDEHSEVKKKLRALEIKELRNHTDNDIPNDIQG